jgi:hypothetical protein
MNEVIKFYIDQMRVVHEETLRERQTKPYSAGDGAVEFRLWVYKNWTVPPLLLELPGITDKDRDMLRAMNTVFAAGKIEAVILRTDARTAKLDKIAEYYRWPAGKPREYYFEQYGRVIEINGGTLANLPKQLWQDAINTVVKGPQIGNHALYTPYGGDDQDRVVLLETKGNEGGVESGIIPDWWQTSTQ